MIRLSPNADSTYWSAPSLDPDFIDLPPPLVYHSVKHSIPLLSSIFNQIEDAATNPYARATGAGALPRSRRRELQRQRRNRESKDSMNRRVQGTAARVTNTASKLVAGLRAAAAGGETVTNAAPNAREGDVDGGVARVPERSNAWLSDDGKGKGDEVESGKRVDDLPTHTKIDIHDRVAPVPAAATAQPTANSVSLPRRVDETPSLQQQKPHLKARSASTVVSPKPKPTNAPRPARSSSVSESVVKSTGEYPELVSLKDYVAVRC